ncbi:MAG: hypothetical protein J5J00_16660 [Deltaproteobacteria bacterium]|nr:hypothetical protein [Deltaproteobacteria bacterium]
MSLISVKNFLAPFSNTTHIVTIVLFVAVFALFRLQGGAVTVRSERSTPIFSPDEASTNSRSADPVTIDDEELGLIPPPRPQNAARRAEPINELPDEGTIEISPSEDSDLLGQMIGKQPPVQQRPADTKSDRARSGGSLEEIERSLGIRQ